MMESKSHIPAEMHLPELTLRVVILSIVLSIVLAISNAYLALKIGILTSASIPAAIISMGILRFFKSSNLLENNLVQTAASAGEAVAGGIVYTIPALIIIQYWTSFSYLQNFFIALTGGVLGVMFSIPLRARLMRNHELRFPEGRAIAELLKISDNQQVGIKSIYIGSLMGASLEFLQSGLKLTAPFWEFWGKAKGVVFGFGLGFSPALIGAGYLIGVESALGIFAGALLSWFILIPIFSMYYPEIIAANSLAQTAAHEIWGNNIRYVGIGAMLTAGLLTVGNLLKPTLISLILTKDALTHLNAPKTLLRTEKDIPKFYALLISILAIAGLYFLYQDLLPLNTLGQEVHKQQSIFLALFMYTIIAGFLFCAITAYLSGMVGVSASPGSAIMIACLLLVALLLILMLQLHGLVLFTQDEIKACEAIVIICTSIITGMAAISNDNMQDLKVGHLLGSTPWKQQVMLLLGVVMASLVITPVMQLLFEVYGIAGVMPRPGMDASLSMPAPPAAIIATLSQAVFEHTIPWNMLLLGGAIAIFVALFNRILKRYHLNCSVLGIAMGIYLPLSSSMALFIGGVISWAIRNKKQPYHADTMLACGLIAGAAMMDVVLAIPFSIAGNPDVMNIAPTFWNPAAIALSLLATGGIFWWFKNKA